MQFATYPTQYDLLMSDRDYNRRIVTRERTTGTPRLEIVYGDLGRNAFAAFQASGRQNAELARHVNMMTCEHHWTKAKRPYYNIYPGVVPYLTRLDLSKVPVDAVRLPVPELLFRFPLENNPFTLKLRDGPYAGRTFPVLNILATIRHLDDPDTIQTKESQLRPGERALLTSVAWNEQPGNLFTQCGIVSSFWFRADGTMEESIQSMADKLLEGDMELESHFNIVRLIATVCLLSTHWEDELVVPDVLKADEAKWAAAQDEAARSRLVEKAKNRGVYGWSIGKSFENMKMSPHWRGPSPFALYWTGPGGKTPLYRYRRGTMVHRSMVEQIPSGHEEG